MQEDYLKVYTQGGKLLGVLENAGDISYSLLHNDLWTASFTLPGKDPKNALCQAHNLVRVPDGVRDPGLYRIVGMPASVETAQGGVKQYSLEHVMTTLLDDVLFGYHEIGGAGVDTGQVIRYILDRQTVRRWALGVCEYADQFVYKFENCTLLSALLSLGNVLTEEYTWDFDTSATPWTVSLRRADTSPGCGIHYMRNMVEIEKTMDATMLVTRLYLLGYGEGVNQLTIRSVNHGLPYLDADTVSVWGVKASVYSDTRIEDAATLKARGMAVLERYKNPYISYTASAIDLTRLTGQEWDKHMPGKLVRVLDGEDGISFTARIVCISKQNVRGRPGEIEITIANAPRDAADSINALADRMGISELYSQGATNLYSQQYADNADVRHPARMRVYVPRGCVRINQMLLSFDTKAFRAYETGAASGGGTTVTSENGGDTTVTSSSGGGSERTSSAGGNTTVITEQKIISNELAVGGAMYKDELRTSTGPASPTADSHTHRMDHYHVGAAEITLPPMPVAIPAHRHTVSIDAHEHKVSLPPHHHGVSLEPHTHGIVHGIYEGGTASSIRIVVDGTPVPDHTAASAEELELAAYLSKDSDGKIRRGVWHTIELVPDRLTRIEANLFVQAFIQSVGGGDY